MTRRSLILLAASGSLALLLGAFAFQPTTLERAKDPAWTETRLSVTCTTGMKRS